MIDPKHYKVALDVQSAVNLSGVVFSFAEAMKAVCAESELLKKGTDWKNTHPICRLFAEQIRHLTSNKEYSQAYQEAMKGTGMDHYGNPAPMSEDT